MPEAGSGSGPGVVVVGGGIAGLALARDLAVAGRSVLVLEAESEPGGCVRAHTVGGLRLDRGAESFATTRPAALALIEELGLPVTSPDGCAGLGAARGRPGATATRRAPRYPGRPEGRRCRRRDRPIRGATGPAGRVAAGALGLVRGPRRGGAPTARPSRAAPPRRSSGRGGLLQRPRRPRRRRGGAGAAGSSGTRRVVGQRRARVARAGGEPPRAPPSAASWGAWRG